MLRRLLLSLALMTVALPAFAQMEPTMPKPLAEQKARGAQVYYMGKFDSLDGWVMIRSGQPEFYYVTPTGNAVVMGLLFNGNGDLLTTQQLSSLPRTKEGGLVDMMASQLPKDTLPTPDVPLSQTVTTTTPVPTPAPVPPVAVTPAPAPAPVIVTPTVENMAPAVTPPTASFANELVQNSPSNQLYLQVQSATSLLYGQEGIPAFYAFVDPNCPHCQQFLKEVEPFVTANKVAVHLIPVGFDGDSMRKAAFALGAADGAKRFVAYAKGDTSQLLARDGISVDGIQSNTLIMERWNLNATPIIVYRDSTGQVKIIKGRPADLAGAIKDLTGQ